MTAISEKKVSELTVDDIATYCDGAGITLKTLCTSLHRLLNAQKVVKWENGVDPIYDNDNNVQIKALSTAFELLKLVGGKVVEGTVQHQHSLAPGDIERLESIATELKGLETRLINDRTQQGHTIDITASQ